MSDTVLPVETSVARLPDGIRLREFLVAHAGRELILTVAEPVARRHPRALALAWEGAAAGCAEAARRGHRVFAVAAGAEPAAWVERMLRDCFDELAPVRWVADPGGLDSATATQAATPGQRAGAASGPVAAQGGASRSYFETEGVWNDAPEPYQVQLRHAVKAFLGERRGRVLDVGCGNGLVTNFLAQDFDVVGVDLSATALRSVRAPRCQGSVTALPFADRSFDFVYCLDVLEHLPWPQAMDAMHELQRVSAGQVLVSLPFHEDLASSSVECPSCGREYHVNGHLRSQDLHALLQLPVAPGFSRSAICLSGDVTVPPPDRLAGLMRQHGLGPVNVRMACPHCGAAPAEHARPHRPHLVERMLGALRSDAWSADVNARWIDRSEGMLLLTRRGHASGLPPATTEPAPGTLPEVRFTNLLQATQDFVAGSQWPRFVQGKGTRISARGIELATPAGTQASPTTIRFPVRPAPGDRLVLDLAVDADGLPGTISLFGIDGLTGNVIPLLVHGAVAAGTGQLSVPLPLQGWWPDRFGLAVDLYVYGGARVERVAYVPARPFAAAQAVPASPGFNLVRIGEVARVPVLWTYHALAAGSMRLPAAGATAEAPARAGAWSRWQAQRALARVFAGAARRIRAHKFAHARADEGVPLMQDTQLEQQRETLRELVEEGGSFLPALVHAVRAGEAAPRVARRAAGRALRLVRGVLRRTVGRLFFRSGMLDVKYALAAYPARWRPVDDAGELPGAGLRVLVVSHMFPHPEQPGLGSFVIEQVQALRQAGIDARVVSGRPFWMTSHRSPLRLLGAAWNYLRLYRGLSSRWWMVDGVPVRFLPYAIVGPFWSHGWTYALALRWNRKRLHRDFQPELIHAHTSYLDGASAREFAAAWQVPYVITEHTGPFSMLMQHDVVRRRTLAAIAGSARLVSVSRAQQQQVLQHLGEAQVPLQVIPNVVDVDRFAVDTAWQPRADAPRLLFVGYFVAIKNLPLLLDAFERVLARKPGATLTLVGGGETEQQTAAVVADIVARGLGQAVHVRGFVDRDEVARLMREECDLLVLQSRSETFGCVVAEALASGKPAVATRCGGPEDIVTEPWMGALCDNGDPQALAQAILEVSDKLPGFDPQRIGASARERFSAAAVAERLVRVYRDVLRKDIAGTARMEQRDMNEGRTTP